jgi:glycosyltransferase involved in cell wall biosynthesis
MTTHVLSNYPLSRSYRAKLEIELDCVPEYISVGELRQLPPFGMLRRVRELGEKRLIVSIEDESSHAVLPMLKILAGFSAANTKEIFLPDLSRRRFSRLESLTSIAALGGASFQIFAARRAARRRAAAMAAAERIVPRATARRKALYLNANLWFGVKAGGSVGHIAGVANALLQRGIGLDFASAGGRQMVSEDANLISLQAPTSLGIPFEFNYYRFAARVTHALLPSVNTGEYDFIYQRMSLCNDSGVQLSRAGGVPLVLEYNGSEVWVARNWGRPLRDDRLAQAVEDANIKHAHAIVTVSRPLADELRERGVPEERIVCYPNCIDPGFFDPVRFQKIEIAKLRRELGIAEDAVVCGFIGTFGQWHGVEVLAAAIRNLAESRLDWLLRNKVHFLIVGDGVRGPATREILDTEAPRKFVTLPGLVPQAQAPLYLAACDVLISPHVRNSDGTRFFGSPTKLFEYMAMGKGIVASDLDQLGEVLTPSLAVRGCESTATITDELAVLAKPGDVNELVAGIRYVVENPTARKTLGENARARALERYTWSRHVEEIMARLKQLGLVSA